MCKTFLHFVFKGLQNRKRKKWFHQRWLHTILGTIRTRIDRFWQFLATSKSVFIYKPGESMTILIAQHILSFPLVTRVIPICIWEVCKTMRVDTLANSAIFFTG